MVISAREDEDFGELLNDEDWTAIEPPAGQRIWTDDYSNVVGAIYRQYRGNHAEAEPTLPEPAAETPAPPAETPAPTPPEKQEK